MEMPISGSKVDVVVSFETIRHLNDPEIFLLECRRALFKRCRASYVIYTREHDENPFNIFDNNK